MKLDNTNILYIMDNMYRTDKTEVSISDVALARKHELDKKMPIKSDHDYIDMDNVSHNFLSEFKKTAISYIAGSAAKNTAKKLWCKECCDALGSPQHQTHSLYLEQMDREASSNFPSV